MNVYSTPELEITEFTAADVISDSIIPDDDEMNVLQ